MNPCLSSAFHSYPLFLFDRNERPATLKSRYSFNVVWNNPTVRRSIRALLTEREEKLLFFFSSQKNTMGGGSRMSSKIGTKSARIVSFPFESHSLSQKDRCSGGFADQTRASPRHVKFPLMASGLIEANWKSISTHGPPRGLVPYNSATMTNGLSKHANATVHEPRINKRVVRARVFIRISIVAFVDSNRVWRGEGGEGNGARARINGKWEGTKILEMELRWWIYENSIVAVFPFLPGWCNSPPPLGLFHFRVKAGKWDFSDRLKCSDGGDAGLLRYEIVPITKMSKTRPVKRRKEGKRGQTLLLAGKYYREGEKEGGGRSCLLFFNGTWW